MGRQSDNGPVLTLATFLATGVGLGLGLLVITDSISPLWLALALPALLAGLILILRAVWRSRPEELGPPWDALNEERKRRYEEKQGLFLVHTWKPSSIEGQVADVTVRLCQHNAGPLTEGKVEAVEYVFGPRFEEASVVWRNPADGFAYTTSMWGPMLCLVRVHFTDDRPPLTLERYINFEAD